jgi:hypothetical protein
MKPRRCTANPRTSKFLVKGTSDQDNPPDSPWCDRDSGEPKPKYSLWEPLIVVQGPLDLNVLWSVFVTPYMLRVINADS